jgi:hypothetical protein
MDEHAPPSALTPRVLSIRRTKGRLVLAMPIARHALLGMLCLSLPLLFWALRAATSGKHHRLSSGIEQPWLAFLVDHLLPDPAVVPWQMSLVMLAFALIGVVLLGHRLVAVVDTAGITTIHSFCFLPYWRSRVSRLDIRSYTVEENGNTVIRGNAVTLYAVKANCTAPPQARFCGFPVDVVENGKDLWQEWVTFSLPGEDAAEYVLELIQEICPSTSSG